jgi:hypothetical protein
MKVENECAGVSTNGLNGRMTFSIENIDVAFWLSFGEVKITIDYQRTLEVAELPQTLLRSIGKIHFNQNLITK